MLNEGIRNALEVLFLETTCQEVLDGLCNPISRHFDYSYPKELFIKKYTEKYNNLTKDQISALFDSIIGDEGESVFNFLSEYAGNCLSVNNGRVQCKEDKILAWNSLAYRVSEDVLVCTYLAKNHISDVQNWNPFLDVAAADLNSLFKKKLVDLHHHLKGSSLNADINWLCLMNHFQCREDKFKPEYGFDYIACIKAAAIRLWLFLRINDRENIYPFGQLAKVLHSKDALQIKFNGNTLFSAIDVVRYNFKNIKSLKQLDYAQGGLDDDAWYSFLYGERYLIRNVLHKVEENNVDSKRISSLLYAYLLSKLAFRRRIVQSNELSGFANFRHFDGNKTLFVKDIPDYNRLLKKVAIASFLAGNEDTRFLETRITPENSVDDLSASIKKTDTDILSDGWYSSKEKRWSYILHFIKEEDKVVGRTAFLPRNFNVRNQVKQQAKSISLLLNSKYNSDIKNRVAGIDAANSEIFCRPEVFAQAFRFLKGEVGRTFHVGEDFYDIVDGLRAIDEVIKFSELGKGDRLGHALALGIDAQEYYNKLDFTIYAPLQVLLDNLCWLYVKADIRKNKALSSFMRDKIKFLAGKLFMNNESFRYDVNYFEESFIYTYYNAWTLRGNDPDIVNDEKYRLVIDDWDRYRKMEEFNVNIEALRLYRLYHFNAELRQRSEQRISLEIDRKCRKDFVESIERAQYNLINEIRKKKIHIECNPTSNCKIGGLEKYEKHPIFIFHPVGNMLPCCFNKSLSVSINTDDKGVFSTSLEREYALLYAAYIKERPSKKNKRRALRWLDGIREDSIMYVFKQRSN